MRSHILFLLLTLFAGTSAHSQWYFEAGVNDSKFAEFVNLSGTKTTLHTYNGLRDFSYNVGYLFPLKVLGSRVEDMGSPNIIRFGLGLGFDQMNLRSRADIGTTKAPVHYNLGQAYAQGNLLLTLPIITKKAPDALGERRSAVNFNAEAGLSYNMYTYATRTNIYNSTINDLKEDKEFVNAYPTFFFGGGLSFPINHHTEVYGKYIVENAFSTDDDNVDTSDETFSTVKRRVMVGLRLDLRLRNKLKDLQEKRMAELEQQKRETVDLTPLYDKIDALEAELKAHEHDMPATDDNNTLKEHPQGFMYLPDFKYVTFALNSSYFEHDTFDSPLNDLATFMQENPQLKLQLVGYADSKTGTEGYNLALSAERAKRVHDYLLKQGVPADQMSCFGAGETLQFSNDNLTKNRRTEIIILK